MARKYIDFEIDEKGCFNCISHAKMRFGYTKIVVNKRIVPMHRFIYEEMFGDIPEGIVIRHKCDNPTCINPEHLETGTHAENMRDKWERGRANHKRKFTDEEALIIINRVLNGESQYSISKELEIHECIINRMISGKTYKHIKKGRCKN